MTDRRMESLGLPVLWREIRLNYQVLVLRVWRERGFYPGVSSDRTLIPVGQGFFPDKECSKLMIASLKFCEPLTHSSEVLFAPHTGNESGPCPLERQGDDPQARASEAVCHCVWVGKWRFCLEV